MKMQLMGFFCTKLWRNKARKTIYLYTAHVLVRNNYLLKIKIYIIFNFKKIYQRHY